MKKLSEMTTTELVDYWSGRLIVSIGAGKFRDEVCTMLLCTMRDTAEKVKAETKKGKK